MIECEHVYKQYKNGTNALYDVNFSVKQGEFVYIIGPTGSGKSTLIKLLDGEELPTKGNVEVVGINVGELKRKQDYDLFSRMINMGCYACNVDESLLKFRADRDNYKRRKSWSYVKGSIKVGVLNFKRGYCSIIDLLYIVMGQMALFILPLSIMTIISDKMLREKVKYEY